MKTYSFAALSFLLFASTLCSADDWPQWRGPNRDGVWRETGLIESFDAPRIPLRWKAKISSGYTGPTVADGRVYVMDRLRQPKDKERVLCFDWKSGKMLWVHAYDCPYNRVKFPAGPRASVTINDGKAYSLGSTAVARCLDAKTGKVIWKKNLETEYRAEFADEKMHIQNLQDLCSVYKFTPLTTGYMPCGEEVAGHLDCQFTRYGPPLFIKRDNGGNLNHAAINEVLEEAMVIPINSPVNTAPYNGAVEHAQGEVKRHLRTWRHKAETTEEFVLLTDLFSSCNHPHSRLKLHRNRRRYRDNPDWDHDTVSLFRSQKTLVRPDDIERSHIHTSLSLQAVQ